MNQVVKTVCWGLLNVLLIVELGLPTVAQKRSNKGQTRSRSKTQNLVTGNALTSEQQAALYVLDQLSESAKKFDDDLLKIRTQAQVADTLWRYDEPRARRELEEAFRALTSVKLDKQNAVSPSSPSASPLSQLQSEVLSLIARRDDSLAEKLINSALEAKSKTDGEATIQGSEAVGERSRLYLQAALSVADTNPERSVQLAEASFAGGVSPSILSVLLTLRRKNPVQANALYKTTLMVARRDLKQASVNMQILASYALPEFTTSGAFGGGGLTQNPGAMSQPDRAMMIEFLDFVYDIFLHLSAPAQIPSANPVDYMMGQRLLPFFVRYTPDRSPMFRNLLSILAQRASQNTAIDTVNNLFQPTGIDDLVKQAETIKDQFQKDLLYFRATMMAAGESDYDRALTLAGKVDNSDFRSGLDSLVHFQAAVSFSQKGEIDLALRYARDTADVRQRAFLLAKIARALFDKKDVARAAEVLADAKQVVAKANNSREKAETLLIITEIETRLDPVRGFEEMETTIKAFNDGDSTASGNVKASPDTSFGLSSMLAKLFKLDEPDFETSFSLLARSNFDRAVQLARMLKKPDLSVRAQLAACRSVLTKPPGKRP
jgi:hypothetical protein